MKIRYDRDLPVFKPIIREVKLFKVGKASDIGRNGLNVIVFEWQNSDGRAVSEKLDRYLGGLDRLEDVVEVQLAQAEGLGPMS